MTIEAAWGEFSVHADGCEECGTARRHVLEEMNRNEQWNRGDILRKLAPCCSDGAELASEWDRLCMVALGRWGREEDDPDMEHISGILGRLVPSIIERRERAGLVGMPETEARDRISALMDVPDAGFMEIMAIEPQERREAAIQAVERSYWAREARRQAQDERQEAPCEVCGKPLTEFQVKNGYRRHKGCKG